MFFIWACRLRRRSPAPSPQPVVVWPQNCKRSFLRSLFCSSVHIASRLCGLSAYALTPRMAKYLRLSAFAVICNYVYMHRYTVANAILVQILKANYLCSLNYHKYRILFTNVIRCVFTKVLYLLRK